MPLMVALIAAAALAEPAATAPLTPVGKWNVDYGATACMLGRTYGTDKAETILALRRAPLEPTMDLMIYTNDRSATMRLGQAAVSVVGGGTGESRYESYPTQASGKRMTRMPVDVALFETLPADAVLKIMPDKMPGWAFALPHAKAAFEALATCNDATVKLWGIDPTERSRIAQPAAPTTSPAYWISPEDYPKTVLGKGAQGTSTVLWTIGVDGRVADCRTVVKSGEVELDKAACTAITNRGRYSPALGFDGKPMISHLTRKVTWRLPGTWSGRN
ncbi:energy transducer TonB [Sphingomonas sp. OK281]|uniref:energy transducer TonB n=1 Tax=Sphingomonas sp. OK281 TaxID=1881067 RepID=UPI0008F075AD|nr:energy transducer TonB [Sphingomonas sp. OK281]SFN68261.1 TonB family C-terminal domain-containing protein [Sphingomonas sp. OK281]